MPFSFKSAFDPGKKYERLSDRWAPKQYICGRGFDSRCPNHNIYNKFKYYKTLPSKYLIFWLFTSQLTSRSFNSSKN